MPRSRLPDALAIILLLTACTSSNYVSPTSPPSSIETTVEPTTTITAPTPTSAPSLLRPETTTRSSYPPGDYWWDPAMGVWVHNPTVTGVGVELSISSAAGATEPKSVPAVIAGFEGTHRQLPGDANGVRTEVWVVDIEGTKITISVSAQPDVTEAELAEAHTIVESIRTEPWETQAGFRMIFTLPAGWDSA